jgi:hypothetical protein
MSGMVETLVYALAAYFSSIAVHMAHIIKYGNQGRESEEKVERKRK